MDASLRAILPVRMMASNPLPKVAQAFAVSPQIVRRIDSGDNTSVQVREFAVKVETDIFKCEPGVTPLSGQVATCCRRWRENPGKFLLGSLPEFLKLFLRFGAG